MQCLINAPAKINLFLEVGKRRSDGYHNIYSLMHSVPLYDTIIAEKLPAANGEKKILFTCSDTALPLNEKNLAYKAALWFFERFSVSSYVLRLHVDKRIPKEAGLGGGSSDAAAVLLCCSRLYLEEADRDDKLLPPNAAALGADVPFCMMRGAAAAFGIGEILEPCPTLPTCILIIAKGPEAISTAAAYRALDKIPVHADRSGELSKLLVQLRDRNLSGICEHLYNRFEEVVLTDCPITLRIKQTMLECGAKGALMSGSGSAVFGIFDNDKMAGSASEVLQKSPGVNVWTLNSKDI